MVRGQRAGRLRRWLSLALVVLTIPLLAYMFLLWAATSLGSLDGSPAEADYYLMGAALALVGIGFIVGVLVWIVESTAIRRAGEDMPTRPFLVSLVVSIVTVTIGVVVTGWVLLLS